MSVKRSTAHISRGGSLAQRKRRWSRRRVHSVRM